MFGDAKEELERINSELLEQARIAAEEETAANI